MSESAKSLEDSLTKEETVRLSAQQLSAHIPVMIRAFPESSSVIIPVDSTVDPKAPEPFTVDITNQMLPGESLIDHETL